MPHVAETVSDLIDRLAGTGHIDDEGLVVDAEKAFRRDTIRDLAWTAAFAADEATAAAAQWLIHEAARVLGAHSASIHELYMARGRGEVHGFTVPAINIRAQTFDMARTVYETAASNDVGAVILELARSEQTYTFQRPIDSSTLVDLSKPTRDEQQRENYRRAAELTALIRSLEADRVTISVGGEIGEVGKENSNEEELVAYLEGYRRELDGLVPGGVGISK